MTARPRALVRGLRGLHLRVRAEAERGTTMVEVVVAMTIMTICGAIFTGAVVTLNRTSNQAQAITNASNQTNQAYQTLDRTVRYASGISRPAVSTGVGATGAWYVELQDTTSGAAVCTQLRVERPGQRLQQRTWSVASPAAVSAWVPIASGLTNGAAVAGPDTQPFWRVPETPTASRQRLKVTLVVRSGPASQPVSSTSSFTLTALNSAVPAPTADVCQEVGRP